MKISPAIKGQLTKARKDVISAGENIAIPQAQAIYLKVREVFRRHLPAEQAKHATRQYLTTV